MATKPGTHYTSADMTTVLAIGGADTLADGSTGLLGARFVGPPASFTSSGDEVGYAAVARGVDGVLLGDLTNGMSAGAQKAGRCKLTVGAAVAIGARLKPDANGKGVAATTTGDVCYAEALEASAADGDVIVVRLFNLPHRPVAA